MESKHRLQTDKSPSLNTPILFQTKQKKGHDADMLSSVFRLVFAAAQIQYHRVHPALLDSPSCLSTQHTFCLRTAFVFHTQYRGGHHAHTTILHLSHPFHVSVLPQRLHSALPPRRTAYGDLLAIAGGDMTDVWQLLEVLPGLMQKV